MIRHFFGIIIIYVLREIVRVIEAVFPGKFFIISYRSNYSVIVVFNYLNM